MGFYWFQYLFLLSLPNGLWVVHRYMEFVFSALILMQMWKSFEKHICYFLLNENNRYWSVLFTDWVLFADYFLWEKMFLSLMRVRSILYPFGIFSLISETASVLQYPSNLLVWVTANFIQTCSSSCHWNSDSQIWFFLVDFRAKLQSVL